MEIFKIQSPAKINLRLKIVERYPDGFHALDMLNCRLSLADEIVLKIMKIDQARLHKFCLTKLEFSKDLQSFDLDSLDNSLVASAKIFESYYPINNYIDFELFKSIPAGGGLGGGSSNAASVIKFLAARNDSSNIIKNGKFIDVNFIKDLEKLSTDIIYNLNPISPALVSGRGEIIKPINHKLPSSYPIFLIFPKIHCSSVAMYKHFSQNFSLSSKDSCLNGKLKINSMDQLTELIENDFLQVVFDLFPELKNLYNQLNNLGFGKVGLSGSGSTFFLIPKSVNDLEADLEKIKVSIGLKDTAILLSELKFDQDSHA